MSRTLKINWVIWLVLSLVVGGGMIALDASTQGTVVNLELMPDRFAEAPMFRLFSSGGIGLELRFERGGRKERSELGTYAVRGGWKEGYLEFLEPGAAIKIQVQVGHDPNVYIFEAGPASGFNKEHIYRGLLPFLYDGDLQHYPWPPPSSRYPAAPSGNSVVHIKVLEVAEVLRGESAVVIIPPPVGIKRVEAGYGRVAMFYLWPVYAFFLGAYGIILILVPIAFSERTHRSTHEQIE